MAKSSERYDLVVAGGGTGGHFFCGLALAQKYLSKYPMARVLFIGVRRGIEARHKFNDHRMSLRFIAASGFKNVNAFQKFEAIFFFFTGILEMAVKLWKMKPKAVVGVGGYVSASTMLAAILIKPLRGFRVAVVEQNSVSGLVNQLLSKIGVPAFAPFRIPGFKQIILPVKEEIEELAIESRTAEWPPKRILVIGGSQGASGLNRAWIQMLPQLKDFLPQCEYVHQTGEQGLQFVQTAYEDLGMKANCFAFSTELQKHIDWADLVISRAGALSILELMAFKRPSIFIPFPGAADDHQRKNAQAVQHHDWIIAENQLVWANLERAIRAERPQIPAFKHSTTLSWRAVFGV